MIRYFISVSFPSEIHLTGSGHISLTQKSLLMENDLFYAKLRLVTRGRCCRNRGTTTDQGGEARNIKVRVRKSDNRNWQAD